MGVEGLEGDVSHSWASRLGDGIDILPATVGDCVWDLAELGPRGDLGRVVWVTGRVWCWGRVVVGWLGGWGLH